MRDGKGKSKYVGSKRNCGPTAQWGRRPSDRAHGKGKTLIAFSALFFLVVKFDFPGS